MGAHRKHIRPNRCSLLRTPPHGRPHRRAHIPASCVTGSFVLGYTFRKWIHITLPTYRHWHALYALSLSLSLWPASISCQPQAPDSVWWPNKFKWSKLMVTCCCAVPQCECGALDRWWRIIVCIYVHYLYINTHAGIMCYNVWALSVYLSVACTHISVNFYRISLSVVWWCDRWNFFIFFITC